MKDAFRQAKVMLSPITPANFELEKAVLLVLSEKGIRVNKTKKKKKAQSQKGEKGRESVNPKVQGRRKRGKSSRKKVENRENMEEKA